MIGNELNGTESGRVEHAAWLAEPERGSRPVMRFITWLALRWGRRATRWLLYPLALYFLAFAPRARRASRAFLTRALAREAGAARRAAQLPCLRGHAARPHVPAVRALRGSRHRHRGRAGAGSDAGCGARLHTAGIAPGQLRGAARAGTSAQGLPDQHRHVRRDHAEEQRGPERAGARVERARRSPPGRPETMLRIKECLERGEIVGILGDRPFGSSKTTLCPFLGVARAFSRGTVSPGARARCADRPVLRPLPGRQPLPDIPRSAGRQSGRRRWRERIAAAHGSNATCERLEHYARAAPYNWFNFYDFWGEGLG